MKKKNINRRQFLKISATAGVGAMILPGSWISAKASSEKETPSFPYRKLGRSGISLPILSMGVMRADNPNLVRAAYNSGIFHFDTAHGYQNGKNEEMLGNFFKDKPRDTFFISTKIKTKYPLEDDYENNFLEMFGQSLQRLQMDHVDILYAHDFNSPEEVAEPRTRDLLLKLKEEGKVKYIGFSTHCHKPELLNAAVESGIYDVILTSYNFKLHNLEETDQAIKRASEAGIGIIAMKTMTGGVEDAEGKNKINAEACLKWAWQNENIVTAIPGFSNYDELDECLAAGHNPGISPTELEYLAGLKDKDMLFCQQCGDCRSQCSRNLPIPDIMRAYMYTYGYKYSNLSKETLAQLNISSDACSDCEKCSIKSCRAGFRVNEKIAAITPIMNIPDEFLT